jgi:hypothetical protein
MVGIVEGFIRGRQAALDERYREADEKRRNEQFSWQREGAAHARTQRGWEGEDRNYVAGERQYTGARRAVLDSRVDEDRAHEVERRPIETQQRDALFNEQVAGARTSRQIAGQREAREQKQFAFQMADAERVDRLKAVQAELGLDDLQTQQAVRRAQKAFGDTAFRVQRRLTAGDEAGALGELEAFYNTEIPDGGQIRLTKGKDKDGNVVIVAVGKDGAVTPLGTMRDVMIAARTLTSPEVFLESMLEGERARAAAEAKEREARTTFPNRYYETVQEPGGGLRQIDRGTGTSRQIVDEQTGGPVQAMLGGNGNKVPAKLQEVSALFEKLPPIEGESPDQRWIRAYEQASQSRAKAPEQAVRDFYQTTLAAMMRSAIGPRAQEQAAARAAELTAAYEGKYFGQQRSGKPAPASNEFDPDAFLQQF